MKLISQVLITSHIDETIRALEAKQSTQCIVKIVKEDTFLVEDAKIVIEKAYMASEEITVIILAAKIFSPIVQNKLLKIIEEPPPNKEFIILTHSKSTILPTIRSRMPIVVLKEEKEVEGLDLDLDLVQLSLATVYTFIQTHKRSDAKMMRFLVERISKEAMLSQRYDLDEKTLTLFSDACIALDLGSPPTFILNTLLLKLLARKKR